MDQRKIGAFIAEKRKEKNLTQAKLAEKLGITDRAVSKWETGRSLPDASVMPELCAELGVTLNDLFSGEVVSMNTYNESLEQHLLDMKKQKEAADRRLLSMEILIGVISVAFFFTMLGLGVFAVKNGQPQWLFWVLSGAGLLQFLVAMGFALRIEQVAGYYKCGKCGHSYVPNYLSVTFAMHVNRTRFMKCPACKKWSWQKKVIEKD